MNWDGHIAELSKTCYPTLSVVQKIKRIAPFNIRKHRSESLVLSKLGYCRNVFNLLRLFSKDDYRKFKILVLHSFLIDAAQCQMSLGWLPIKERTEIRMLNLCYQALHKKIFPEYLKLNFAPKKCLLRASNDNGPMVEVSGHKCSFISRAANLFNELPKKIRRLKKENTFKSETKYIIVIEY